MTDATIHLRTTAARKGRWIRASRAAGMRLTDWIIERVERGMENFAVTVVVPEGLDFAELRLGQQSDGGVTFDWEPVKRICEASGMPWELLRDGPEDNVSALLVAWYSAHRAAGGDTDPVAESLIAEVQAEDAARQRYSFEPGHA